LHTRELLIDGLVQGGMDVGTGLPVYEYTYFLQLLPYATHPGGERALVIGLGAGLVPRWYESRGIVTDVVDIDPSIAHVARTYFGYRGAGDVIVADARSFLSSPGRRYDYIIVDVFNGDTTPGHVLSLEALRLMKARLNREGVVAFNLVGSLERHTFMTASVVAKGVGSVLIAPYEFPAKTPSMLLTDDFNPMDVHDAWLRERVRRNILETTNWGILLGRLPIAAFERFYG
jgi:spermidine synthase